MTKSPLTPLCQIPQNAGLPLEKGGKEGFYDPCRYCYETVHNIMLAFFMR